MFQQLQPAPGRAMTPFDSVGGLAICNRGALSDRAPLLKIIFDKPFGRRYRTGSSNENDYQEGH
jgi:hypothetical protein